HQTHEESRYSNTPFAQKPKPGTNSHAPWQAFFMPASAQVRPPPPKPRPATQFQDNPELRNAQIAASAWIGPSLQAFSDLSPKLFQ
ncbi:MAG TPA: hypothetical protein VNU68_20920, partial [Verrucomicrobiae bacterium]|nr:hypothetical protein [Verrucomicrobiae bacterium]